MSDQNLSGGEFRIGRVLSRCVEAVVQNLTVFAVLALMFSIVPDVLVGVFHMNISAYDPNDLGQSLRGVYGEVILVNLINICGSIGAIYATVRHAEGRPASLGDCLAQIGPNYFPVLGLSIITNIAIVFGLVFLIVPGVWVAVVWAVVLPVRVMEQGRQGPALDRSSRLTAGHRGPILGAMAIATVLGLLAAVLYGVVFAFVPPIVDEVIATPVLNAAIVMSINIFTASIYAELILAKHGLTTAEVFS